MGLIGYRRRAGRLERHRHRPLLTAAVPSAADSISASTHLQTIYDIFRLGGLKPGNCERSLHTAIFSVE